jgi:hypothetical protein
VAIQSKLLETSACNASTWEDSFEQLSATFSASPMEEEHVMITFQPFSESIFAVAAPTPLLPPVTIATGLSDIVLASFYKK